MLDPTDPRSALASYGAGTVKPASAYAPAEYARFYEMDPQESNAQSKTWWMRAQNLILAYSTTAAGTHFEREDQPDEFCVLLVDPDSSAELTTDLGTESIAGMSLTIVPPGRSALKITAGGRIVRIFSIESTDLIDLCINRDSYQTSHPNVEQFRPWPGPADGYRVRTYSLRVPKGPGRHGTIYRCSTLMVNFVDVYEGPRDPSKLSPHSHDDFEQISLLIDVEVIHHVRFPWTANFNMWIEDEHVRVGSPSMAILPPPAIHTTMSVGPGVNQLIDIFSPPRMDWSEQPGWVLNEAEYPLPPR